MLSVLAFAQVSQQLNVREENWFDQNYIILHNSVIYTCKNFELVVSRCLVSTN